LRKAEPATADGNLVTINAAIYRAAGFYQKACEEELQRASFPPVLGDLKLDALLRLVRFVGSIQEQGKLRRKQIRFAPTDLDTAIQVGTAAASILMDWPRSFREMLRRMVPGQIKSAADLSFYDVFGNFYRHLYAVLPRKEFGFLHDAFEEFVVQDWKGLVRGQHRFFPNLTRRNSQWMPAQEAETTMHMTSKRLGALVRNRELEGIFVKTGRHRTECWIRRESLSRWAAKREAELARYMSRPEAKGALGLGHDTLLTVAQAGLIRYVSGSEKFSRTNGVYFLREDVLRIKPHSKNMLCQSSHIPDRANLSRCAMGSGIIWAEIRGFLQPSVPSLIASLPLLGPQRVFRGSRATYFHLRIYVNIATCGLSYLPKTFSTSRKRHPRWERERRSFTVS